MSLWLPHLDRFNWIDQHKNIEGEIISYPKETTNFKHDNYQDTHPDLRQSCNNKANNNHPNITDRIEDTISDIPESNGRLTVPIDDNRGIFEQFPSSLEQESSEKFIFQRESTSNEPEKGIKENTVNNVRKGIRIGNTLRIFTSPYITIPPAKTPIRTKNRATSRVLDEAYNGKNDYRAEKIKRIFLEKMFHKKRIIWFSQNHRRLSGGLYLCGSWWGDLYFSLLLQREMMLREDLDQQIWYTRRVQQSPW